jgi:hypothetical protein
LFPEHLAGKHGFKTSTNFNKLQQTSTSNRYSTYLELLTCDAVQILCKLAGPESNSDPPWKLENAII